MARASSRKGTTDDKLHALLVGLKRASARIEYLSHLGPASAGSMDAQRERLAGIVEEMRRVLSETPHSRPTAGYVPYPAPGSPDFAEVLAAKREFDLSSDLSSVVDACDDAAGFEPTRPQRFVARFMSPHAAYRSLILVHDVGTGKTCSAIRVAEALRGVLGTRALVLYPRNAIRSNFRRAVADVSRPGAQCTGTTYVPASFDASQRDIVERAVARRVDANYEFVGFIEFANSIQSLDAELSGDVAAVDAVLRRLYSNRVIIIDEAHNLNAAIAGGGDKVVPPQVTRALRCAENSRLLLLTATPMYDKAAEIVSLVNLVLANEKLPPLAERDVFDASGRLKPGGAPILERAVGGFVSVVRASDGDGARPVRLSPADNSDPRAIVVGHGRRSMVLAGSRMRGQQLAAYEAVAAFQDVGEGDDDVPISWAALGLSTVAFPGHAASTGRAGFDACFETVDGTSRFRYKASVLRDAGAFLAPDRIADHAAKLDAIVGYAARSSGIVFVYSKDLYNGLLPLAFALEHAGFRRRGAPPLLVHRREASAGALGNYAILCGDKGICPDFESEVRAINSAANREGRLVKVFLATSVAAEGVDFACIREVHVLEPWFNINRVEQVVGRAVRKGSHASLPPERRNVTVYLHAATTADGTAGSLDVRIYERALKKQAEIDRVMASLERVAVDRFVVGDQAGVASPVAQVSAQGKKIAPAREKKQDKKRSGSSGRRAAVEAEMSTFVPELIDDDVRAVQGAISCALRAVDARTKWSWTFDELADATKSGRDVLALAISRMIESETRVVDVHGRRGVLMRRGASFVFQDVFDVRRSAGSIDREGPSRNVGSTVVIRMSAPISVRSTAQTLARVRDVLNDAATAVQRLLRDLPTAREIPRDVAYDFVVDRFDQRTSRAVGGVLLEFGSRAAAAAALQVADPARLDAVVDSMASGRVLTETAGRIVSFLDLYDRVVHERGSTGLVRRDVADADAASQLGISAPPWHEHRPLGCLDIETRSGCQFKAIGRERNASGTVCQQTSSIDVRRAAALIDDVDPVLRVRDVEYSKRSLCQLYELALRMRRDVPRSFMRPAWWVFQYKVRYNV